MNCCAVIVTFYPESDISGNISALRDQVNEIIIVDNGSSEEYREMLKNISLQYGATIIYNNGNLGVAAALNIGIRAAKRKNHQWVITFDQDSKATPDMVKTMFKAYDASCNKDQIASLSPCYLDENKNILWRSRSRKSNDDLPYSEVSVVITSGNLIKINIFDSVGYFNEDLFIDYVDKEFCLRCITQNYKILEVKEAVLLHIVGLPTKICSLFTGIITTTNHSHLRRYYIARNSIYTYKIYFLKVPIWVLMDVYYLLGNLLKAIVFEEHRIKRLVATAIGFYDGLIGNFGKCKRDRFF